MKRVRIVNLRNLFRAGKLGQWQRALAAVILVCAATATMAQTYTTLASFTTNTNGNEPNGLAQGVDGNFYGTTLQGGANSCNCGGIFKITPSGKLTGLYSFGSSPTDGMYPSASLTLGSDGNFYGTTNSGGANEGGTVFQFNPSTNALKVLWNFPMSNVDGTEPLGPLVLASDGNFYGTTYLGGKYSSGMIFKISTTGTLNPVYSFCAEGYPCMTTGMSPESSLMQLDGGSFYGTTYSGGEHMSGTMFQITPTGTLTKLYDFKSSPSSGLVLGIGKLYGTTGYGGANGSGWIYDFSLLGPGTIYSFCSLPLCTDGVDPAGQLLLGTDSSLYGTTYLGGMGNGVAYWISPKVQTLNVLHTFAGTGGDGVNPESGMIEATTGALYGTTNGGGANGDGTVFSVTAIPTLHRFLETVPIAGPVGTSVVILGNGLTGATSVTFNGTADPTFTVVSGTEITANVPNGATTGKVKVVTAAGKTLVSNVAFSVIP